MLHKSKSCIRKSFHIVLRNQFFKMSKFPTLNFDNLALRRLPVDKNEDNCVRMVRGACYAKTTPTPLMCPLLVAYSPSALLLLDLPSNTEVIDFAQHFSGNKILPGSETAAHCYCGHQFGVFAGQLGDGAVTYLGEVVNSKNKRYEIQLKGAGKTPFSRTADGRKVLRSSIREFLCSEAMHFLGIPTTRAGTCVESFTSVPRPVYKNGCHSHVMERCAVVLRIAPTFIRFGSFEIFNGLDPLTNRFGPSYGRVDMMHTMIDYVIETYFPEIHNKYKDRLEKVSVFYKEVVLRTARLVALWQSVGFCHGVLNTDNMSILGLTMDYGPFGFLDVYNPHHICNGSDVSGRYSFNSQPDICKWNLLKLAEALKLVLPSLISDSILEMYDEEFKTAYMDKMRAKLGLIVSAVPEDKNLVDDLFDTMERTGADFTNTFLCLLFLKVSEDPKHGKTFNAVKDMIVDYCYTRDELVRYYRLNFGPGQLRTFKQVTTENPELVNQTGPEGSAIRKVLIQIDKSEHFQEISDEMKKAKDYELWLTWLIKYKCRIEQDMKTFDGDADTYHIARDEVMKSNNPRLILRNYIAQEAIEKAETRDYTRVQELIKSLEKPYSWNHTQIQERIYAFYADPAEPGQNAPPLSRELEKPHAWIFDRAPPSAFNLKIT